MSPAKRARALAILRELVSLLEGEEPAPKLRLVAGRQQRKITDLDRQRAEEIARRLGR